MAQDPYRHLQRCKGRGADCTLFVGQALLDARLLTVWVRLRYPIDWHGIRGKIRAGGSPAYARLLASGVGDDFPFTVGAPTPAGGGLMAFSTGAPRDQPYGLVGPAPTAGFRCYAINDQGVSFTPLGT